MATQIYQIRPPTVGLSYENWQDDAICHELPFELFELEDFGEVERGEQERLIAEGLKVCSSCPVRAACLTNSSELDRHWTTRGGQPPEGLFEDAIEPGFALVRTKNGFFPGEGPKRAPKEKCKRGHKDWRVDKRGKRRCVTCQRIDNRTAWQKRKKKPVAVVDS